MRKNIPFALLLCLPILIFFCGYWFNHDAGLRPTGFIQYDNVSYIAFAKQYLDGGSNGLQYSNPFNDSNGYTPIYFQSQTLFFALLLKLGVPAGFILPFFTLLCSFICFLLVIAIYDLLVPPGRNRALHIWLFAWGGGLLAFAGAIFLYFVEATDQLWYSLFVIDPEGGWWGLSLGRSLFFSCEAYYHCLFLGSIFFILKKKYRTALLTSFILTLSHPFTGIELASILVAWSGVEWLLRRREIPLYYVVCNFLILGFHLWFYLFYLESFSDHQSVSKQYSLTWGLRYYRMIPAYCLVGFLALFSAYKAKWFPFFRSRHNRIFFCWFCVAFLLANHEIFMPARQPIHFTRGYIWTSLFLLGLPGLVYITNELRTRGQRWVFIMLIAIVFLFDNAAWTVLQASRGRSNTSELYTSAEQDELFCRLDDLSDNETMIISRNLTLSYLSTVYTKAYPLYSHVYTTPFAGQKKEIWNRIFTQGILDSSICNRKINLIIEKSDSLALKAITGRPSKQLYQSPSYRIIQVNGGQE